MGACCELGKAPIVVDDVHGTSTLHKSLPVARIYSRQLRFHGSHRAG